MELVLLASRFEASLFENTDYGSLKLIKKFSNPLGRLKNKGLQNDQPGMSRAKRKGSAPHSLTAEKSPHEEAASQFAKKLVSYLKKQWNNKHELSFKVVAEPHLLGLIKGQFGNSKVLDRVTWLEKDLQNVPPSKWPKILGLKRIPMNKDMEITNSKTI